jgi:Stage II sporulation protein E (SpoIIE)
MLPRGWDRRTTVFLAFVLLVLSGTKGGSAQVFDLERDRVPLVELNGAMRFHTGDDPRWADPGWDDSHWSVLMGNRDWASQGFPGLSGFGWYRAKLLIPAGEPSLWLFIPRGSIRTEYDIFADGKMLEGCSSHSYFRPDALCPLGNAEGASAHSMLLAIRVWHSPYWAGYYAGGLQGGLRIGGAGQIGECAAFSTDRKFLDLAKSDVLALLYGLAGIFAFGLFLLRHREREYLWFGGYSALWAAALCYRTWIDFHPTGFQTAALIWILIICPANFCFVGFYYVMFKGRRNWLFWVAMGSIAAVLPVSILEVNEWINLPLWSGFITLGILPCYVWVIYLVVRRAAEGFPDARLIVVPTILELVAQTVAGLSNIFLMIGWIHEQPHWITDPFHWPFPFDLIDLADFIFLQAMVAILMLRFNRVSTQGERLAAELEAARIVQQILLPKEIPAIPGFAIQSVYKPAAQVGGDFFQLLPTGLGGVLALIGDVSGKGMPAAMIVSLLVGTARTLAESTDSPGAILTRMNQRMIGRTIDCFTTCLVLRIDPGGAVTLANAGHLAPYLGAQELAVENGLPLGLAWESVYSESFFHLDADQELTLLTDGIAEARTKTGELFGFERTAAISTLSAEHIADTAVAFGQEDDITVLKIRRCPVLEPARTPLAAAPSTSAA